MQEISINTQYKSAANRLWRALTERAELKLWYFDFPDTFKAEVGAQFDWYAGPSDGEQWLHRGKMLEVIPGKKLMHSWEYPGYSGSSKVCWELSAVDAENTRLIFTHTYDVPFDPSVEALKRENFVEGWKYNLHRALSEHLTKSKP